MFVFACTTFALAAVGSVSGLVVPRKEAPNGWLPNILENYDVYHTRYLALGCQSKHNTAFFSQCCHPLLKSQKLADRPAQCTPSKTTSSVAPPAPTDNGDDDDDECDDSDDDDTSEVPTSTAHSSHAASTTRAVTTTPKPSSTHKPSSTQSAATPSKSATGSSQVFTNGFATFFYQNNVAGACGIKHSDNELIAAIDERRYGNSGLKSSLCGKKVQITNPKNGKSVVVTIADDCPTCENSNSIDLSVAAFNKIATEAEGMVNIHWNFI